MLAQFRKVLVSSLESDLESLAAVLEHPVAPSRGHVTVSFQVEIDYFTSWREGGVVLLRVVSVKAMENPCG